ncbi:MAG: DUF2190 family protein [Burkholderiaceae bacterium]|nr:DUF2190 family protein [Burkholderiaceae bacterium]
MSNQTLTKQLIAEGAISPNRFVKFGSTDEFVVQAAAATDSIIGVYEGFGSVGAVANDRVDVVLGGLAEVKFGGAVTRGGEVTSDASGQAVASAPAAGSNNRLGGIAFASAVNGDIARVIVALGMKQG